MCPSTKLDKSLKTRLITRNKDERHEKETSQDDGKEQKTSKDQGADVDLLFQLE